MIILKKYGERAKLYYIDTDKIFMKASDIIKKKKKKKNNSNYIFERTSLPMGNNEKIIEWIGWENN